MIHRFRRLLPSSGFCQNKDNIFHLPRFRIKSHILPFKKFVVVVCVCVCVCVCFWWGGVSMFLLLFTDSSSRDSKIALRGRTESVMGYRLGGGFAVT